MTKEKYNSKNKAFPRTDRRQPLTRHAAVGGRSAALTRQTETGKSYPDKRSRPDPVREAEQDELIIYGRNAVLEALKSGRTVEKIFLRKGDREGSVKVIAALAAENGIPFAEATAARLEEMTGTTTHQGVAALVSPVNYLSLDELVTLTEEKGEKPFFLLLDDINDPHNLGAILRSAECCGVNGVILPKRHSAPVSSVAVKASAGAVHYLPLAKVSSITAAVEYLKKAGVWIYGAQAGGEVMTGVNMTGAFALVMGSEGSGLSRPVQEQCDGFVSIPMYGKIDSFNVSCAAAILLSEAARQRHSGE